MARMAPLGDCRVSALSISRVADEELVAPLAVLQAVRVTCSIFYKLALLLALETGAKVMPQPQETPRILAGWVVAAAVAAAA